MFSKNHIMQFLKDVFVCLSQKALTLSIAFFTSSQSELKTGNEGLLRPAILPS